MSSPPRSTSSSFSSPPSPSPGSQLSATSAHRRRPSRSDGSQRIRSRSPLPLPSISSSPTPLSSSPAASPALSLPSSLLTASASVQQAAGSWWKKANALYQQATTSQPPTVAAATASTVHPSSSAEAAPASSSSFLSSVLHSVTAAVAHQTQLQPQPPNADEESALNDGGLGGGDVELVEAEVDVAGGGLRCPPPPPSLSAFELSRHRMALLSSALCDERGGWVTPSLFLPRAAWFLPSLRLPAVLQKLQSLEAFHAQLEEVRRAVVQWEAEAANARPSSDRLLQQLDGLLSTCRRLQNDLAFSLTSIRESTQPPSTAEAEVDGGGGGGAESAAVGGSEGLSDRDGGSTGAVEAAAAQPSSSASTAAPSPPASSGPSAVDRLSSRVKALSYSLARSAHRISKAVLADRMSREHAELYLVFLQRIDAQLTAMDGAYHQARERRGRGTGGAGAGEVEALDGKDEAEVVRRFDAVGAFVCEVLSVFILDDVQRALLRYVAEQQEALSRGVRQKGDKETAHTSHNPPTSDATPATAPAPDLPPNE